MSFATSQPIINRFFGGVDVATAARTHMLANVPNQKREKFRIVTNAIAASVRVHPIRAARVFRRMGLIALDLVN